MTRERKKVCEESYKCWRNEIQESRGILESGKMKLHSLTEFMMRITVMRITKKYSELSQQQVPVPTEIILVIVKDKAL